MNNLCSLAESLARHYLALDNLVDFDVVAGLFAIEGAIESRRKHEETQRLEACRRKMDESEKALRKWVI